MYLLKTLNNKIKISIKNNFQFVVHFYSFLLKYFFLISQIKNILFYLKFLILLHFLFHPQIARLIYSRNLW